MLNNDDDDDACVTTCKVIICVIELRRYDYDVGEVLVNTSNCTVVVCGQVLDDEAEVFVVKMWRLLIYETEAKKLGLVK